MFSQYFIVQQRLSGVAQWRISLNSIEYFKQRHTASNEEASERFHLTNVHVNWP